METVSEKRFNWRYLLKSIGPGIFLAATAIGPGSIVSASTTGARFGYSLFWWIIIIVAFRGLYQYASAKYGLSTEKSVIEGTREHYGPVWALLSAFFAFLSFVSYSIGNFTGVGLGLNILFPSIPIAIGSLIGLSAAIITFFMRNMFVKVEKVMKLCIAVMVLVFLVTYIITGVANPREVTAGLIPNIPKGSMTLMLSLLGTTASLAACSYASSLVKNKGWTKKDIKNGMILVDTIASMIFIGLITLLVIFVSAEVFRGSPISNGRDLANGLAGVIGNIAKPLVGFGLLSAAFSSLVGSPKIAMNLLLQGLGKKSDMDNRIENLGCVAIVIFAAIVGLIFGKAPAQLMILAQIGGAINTPIIGIMIILLINRKEMGEYKASKGFTACISFAYLFILYQVITNAINLVLK